MALGTILGRAGAASTGFRTGEDQARRSRSDQLRLEELNRIDEQRRLETQGLSGLGPPSEYKLPEYIPQDQMPIARTMPRAAERFEREAAAPVPVPAPSVGVRPQVSDDDLRSRIRQRLTEGRQSVLSGYSVQGLGVSPGIVRPPVNVTDEEVEAELNRIKTEAAKPAGGPTGGRSSGAARRRAQRAQQIRTGNIQMSPNFEPLAGAVEMVESGGNFYAVNPESGASGSMQTMKETLRDPGFGVTPAQDDSAEEKRRVGRDYLAAMLREFKGNTEHALIAYNWGPGNAKNWIARGENYEALPAETQDYIVKVADRLGGKVPQPTQRVTQAAPEGEGAPATGPAVETVAPTPGVRKVQYNSPTAFYAGRPEALAADRQVLDQQYNYQRQMLANRYNSMVNSGMGPQATEVAGQIMQLDTGYRTGRLLLDGQNAVNIMEYTNDPRPLAQVLSFHMSQDVQVQPVDDGTFNLMIGQNRVGNYDKTGLANMAKGFFDQQWRQATAARMGEVALKRLESDLKREEKYSEQQVQAIIEIAKLKQTGNNAIALEREKQLGFNVTVGGDGKYVVTRGEEIGIVSPGAMMQGPDGIEFQAPPKFDRVAGL